MIGRRGGGIVAVIRRQHHQIIPAQPDQQARHPRVQLLETLVKPRHVVAVPPRLIEFNDIDEHESRFELIQRTLNQAIRVLVRRRMLAADVSSREQIVDLADADAWNARFRQPVEQRRPDRFDRKILPLRRAAVVPGLTFERSRDHAAHGMLPHQHLACDRAGAIQLLERNRTLVRRNLKHRVRRRIDDPLPRALMLGAELVDDRGTGRRLVAEPAAPRPSREFVEQRNRESLRVRPKRFLQENAADLPMPGGAVFSR